MDWALIMAGGQGTRFWPESRAKKPKQFLQLFGKKSLLEHTVSRLKGVVPASRILVVTQAEKVSLVSRLARIPKKNIIGEPVGRNTAPCAALIAAQILRKDPEAVLAILPSDHHIAKEPLFRKLLKTAFATASKKRMPVTFGIKADFPHTGYGYLETASFVRRQGGFKIYHLKAFHEKPDQRRAEKYLKAGNFYWNSGMFVWRADELLKTAKQYLPVAYAGAVKIAAAGCSRAAMKSYHRMPNISIDYGLMEKLRGKILTIPVDMGWSDVGDWKVLSGFWSRDRDGNTVRGNSLAIESSGNVVRGGRRLIALLGVHDHVIVDTDDALLVCSKHKTESIRKIVDQLKLKKWKQYL